MRVMILIFAVCLLASCDRGVAGSWTVDRDAMKADLDAKLEQAPEALRETLKSQIAEVLDLGVTLDLKSNDTFTILLDHVPGGGRMRAAGTWSKKLDRIEFEMNEKNGEKLPEPVHATGTLKDGKLHLQAPGMSTSLVLIRK